MRDSLPRAVCGIPIICSAGINQSERIDKKSVFIFDHKSDSQVNISHDKKSAYHP